MFNPQCYYGWEQSRKKENQVQVTEKVKKFLLNGCARALGEKGGQTVSESLQKDLRCLI